MPNVMHTFYHNTEASLLSFCV